MFWEISDILWKCFGFHWLAKLAEIIKTYGKNQCFWRSLTTYGRALKSQVGRSHQKKQKKTQKTLEKHRFPPMLFCPGDIFIFISIYLPAITCSHFKLRPSPTYWPTVCLPIYLCVYIHICNYMHVLIFRFIYLPAITCSHFKFRPSPTYWPTVCLPIYLCIYIYMYVCICFCTYIFTCNHLQLF